MTKTTTEPRILNVLHQSNDGYTSVCATSIVSMLENNKYLDEINIYYLAYKLSAKNKKRLQQLIAGYKNASIDIIDAQPYHDRLKELGVNPWRGLYVTWLKLLALADLRLNTDRILYINAHTIVNSSLDGLIDFDFEDSVMGLSYDSIVTDHKTAIGLKETDNYYNCGVMLINHKKWLKEAIGKEVIDQLAKKSNYPIVDQDFCNVVFQNRIKLLSATYNFSSAYYGYDLRKLLKVNKLNDTNFYSYDELMSDYYAPIIIHSLFGIVGKPWEQNNKHPQRFLWSKYRAMTPWRNDQMPVAKYNINWFLYDVLPSSALMILYKFAVYNKYGKEKRSKLLVKFFDMFTPQKGT